MPEQDRRGAEEAVELGVLDKLLALHDSLNAARIQHAFGGAIALAYAVREPRATIDIDVNIFVPVQEAGRVLEAMPKGVLARAGAVERLVADGQDRLRWGDVPIDLFFPQHEFHATVASRAVDEPLGGRRIAVVSPTDLVVFKTMFDRSKDWPDIEAILRAGSAEVSETLRWTEVILGVAHRSRQKLVKLVGEIEGAASKRSASGPSDGDPNVWKRLG